MKEILDTLITQVSKMLPPYLKAFHNYKQISVPGAEIREYCSLLLI
jgi:hypothetical protein